MSDTYNFQYSVLDENGERHYLIKKENLTEKEVLQTLFSVVKDISRCITYFKMYKYFIKEANFSAFIRYVINTYNLFDPFSLHIYRSDKIIASLYEDIPSENDTFICRVATEPVYMYGEPHEDTIISISDSNESFLETIRTMQQRLDSLEQDVRELRNSQ